MGHQRVGGTLLSLAQTFKRLDPSDPVTQCLAPRLSRKFATHTDLPIVARPTYKPTPINPNVDPSLYSPPKLLTTLHSWPELEPVRYAWYGSQYLDVPLRRDLLHRAVIYEADGTRMGTAFARHRTDIPGSNRKVLPQKGTGRARAGDSKSPIRKGGGVAHGPKPRDFSTELPRKIYDRAWRTALSYRYRKGELMVLDGHIDISDHQTARFLYNFFTKSKTNQSLLVAGKVRKHLSEAMGQVGKFGKIKDIEDVDVKDMLSSARIVIEQKALNALLLAHSSDLGYDCSLGLAVKFANTELPGAFFRANVGGEAP